MLRCEVTSKILASVGYDPPTKTLEVELRRRQGDAARPVYQYSNVSVETWAAMNNAESMGSYFLTYVVRNHPFKKIEVPDEGAKETNSTVAATKSALQRIEKEVDNARQSDDAEDGDDDTDPGDC